MANEKQKPMREQGPRHDPKDFDRESLPYDPPAIPPPYKPEEKPFLPNCPPVEDVPASPGYEAPNWQPTRKD